MIKKLETNNENHTSRDSLMLKKGIAQSIVAMLLLLSLVGCSTNIESDTATTEIVVEQTSNNSEKDISTGNDSQAEIQNSQENVVAQSVSLADIPAFSGNAYVTINNNVPSFTAEEITATSFESYSSFDSKGRCQVAVASVGQDLMPTEERGSIGPVKPSGWHTVKYDCVDGKYLYNRCHLIGYQLTAENANEKNLITGTRYLNIEGMLPFENMVADYVKSTNNHVMYRVTPIFEGGNLVASGVLMEGYSVEDSGSGICFHVYAYNVQPGVTIDYATGDSQLDGTATDNTSVGVADSNSNNQTVESTYVLNTNTKKFHKPSCSSVGKIKDSNKDTFTGSREELISQGYEPCKSCNP